MASARGQASSVGMPPIHGVPQNFVDGYGDYKINIRFNLSFPDGVVLGSDGLPHDCILVFGPNAFPAIYGPDGTIIEKFRMEWPLFDINYIRLSKEEELITGGLQMVLWINRRYRHGPLGIQFTEANLLHGMHRWAQYRTMKSRNRYPEPQLMSIDEYLRTNPHEFIAPQPNQTVPSATSSHVPPSHPAAVPRSGQILTGPNASRPHGVPVIISRTYQVHQRSSSRPRNANAPTVTRLFKEEDDEDSIVSTPPRTSKHSSSRIEQRDSHREEARASSRVRYRSPERASHGRRREEAARTYRERSYSPEPRVSYGRSHPHRSDVPHNRVHSVSHRGERRKHRSRSPRPY